MKYAREKYMSQEILNCQPIFPFTFPKMQCFVKLSSIVLCDEETNVEMGEK